MIDHEKSPVTAIIGGSGQGKTTLLRRRILPHEDRWVLIDPTGEHAPGQPGEGNAYLTSAAGFARAVDSLRACAAEGVGFRWIVQTETEDDWEAAVGAASLLTDTVIVLEEIGKMVSSRGAPKILKDLARLARRRRAPLIWLSQRIVDVPEILYSYADVYAFRTRGKNDMDRLRSTLGAGLDAVGDLAEGEFLFVPMRGVGMVRGEVSLEY